MPVFKTSADGAAKRPLQVDMVSHCNSFPYKQYCEGVLCVMGSFVRSSSKLGGCVMSSIELVGYLIGRPE